MKIQDYIHKYRKLLIFFIHILLIAGAYILAYLIRFEFILEDEYPPLILKTLPWLLTIKILVFYYYGLYSGLWRYVSMDDVWRILKASTISTVIFLLYVVFTIKLWKIPRSIFILDWNLCIGLTVGIRFLSRTLRERFRPIFKKRKKKVLIIGAGEAGIQVVRESKSNPHINFDIAGFIDDDPRKRHLRIHGIKVLGNKHEIARIVDKYEIEEIIIAIPSAKGEVIRDIISHCEIPDIKVKIVPGLHKILDGELEIKLRDVKTDDLLGRETVQVNEEEIASYIKNKRILITGACGSIGSELSRQIAGYSPNQVILIDYNENDTYFLEMELKIKYPELRFKQIVGDIRDISLLKHAFSRFRPQIVFHAAAFKHVPVMEENPSSAIKNNVITTRNIIYASEHYGVERFVFISTDKAVKPASIMGASKRIGEIILQAKAKTSRTRFIAVRFGNVLGSKGSVAPLFKKQIEELGPVTVTHPEASRFFMSLKEAVQLVLQAGAMGKGGEVFILDMGEQIKIKDLAENLIKLSGLKPGKDISIEYIGLRPGEKLKEEIMRDAERDGATRHNRIFIAKPDDFDPKVIRNHVKELERLSNLMDEAKIIEKIKEIVPSYKAAKNG